MGLIYVEGADPNCRRCLGSGVMPLLGFGAECYCVSEQKAKSSTDNIYRAYLLERAKKDKSK